MNSSEEYTVKIEKLVNEGAGFARINGIPVFINNTCPEDEVKIRINKVNKHYCTADVIELISQSKYRTEPLCKLHNVCGSCNWQHIEYNEQLKQKQITVKETIRNIAGIDVDVQQTIPSPKISEYRCKIQMPVSQTKVSKRILSGYYKKNSHELINIKYCPMQPKIINELSEFIKIQCGVFNIGGYNEKTHKGMLRHIIYRLSSDNNQILVVLVINSAIICDSVKKLAESIMSKDNHIVGVCANFNDKKTNVILGKHTIPIIGNDYYVETLDKYKYKVSANSFFQVNPLCAAKIFNTVKNIISSNCKKPSVLDAYSGVSSFGIWLSSVADKVVSVEEIKSASDDAAENVKINNIANIEILNGDAGKIFSELKQKHVKFDVSIIDPPRKGADIEALNNLNELTSKYIVYVSCNPATLARDIKILLNFGFRVDYVQPADMFPHTYHVETIVLLTRK